MCQPIRDPEFLAALKAGHARKAEKKDKRKAAESRRSYRQNMALYEQALAQLDKDRS